MSFFIIILNFRELIKPKNIFLVQKLFCCGKKVGSDKSIHFRELSRGLLVCLDYWCLLHSSTLTRKLFFSMSGAAKQNKDLAVAEQRLKCTTAYNAKTSFFDGFLIRDHILFVGYLNMQLHNPHRNTKTVQDNTFFWDCMAF